MLGHLVLGRYGSAPQTQPAAPREPGWMTRVIRALLRKRA